MKLLMLFPMGADRCGRPIYATPEGCFVVDVDYQKNPRTDLRTKWPAREGYYGEPDCRLGEDVTPVFMDDVVTTMNEALERKDAPYRYTIVENRMFVCNAPEDADDFDELTDGEMERVARNVLPALTEGCSIDDIMLTC